MIKIFVYIFIVLFGLHSKGFGYDREDSLQILYEGYQIGTDEFNLFEFILAYFMLAMSVHVIAKKIIQYRTLYPFVYARKKQINKLYNALFAEVLKIAFGLTAGALLIEFAFAKNITMLLIYYHIRYVLVLLAAAICLISAMASGNNSIRRELIINIVIMLGLILTDRADLSKTGTISVLMVVNLLYMLFFIRQKKERL